MAVFLLTVQTYAADSSDSASDASVRDSLPILQLKKLKEFATPEGASYLEGGTALSGGYLVAFLSSTGGNPNPLILFNTSDWSISKTASVQLSHANDMCFVPESGEIFVTPMDSSRKELIVLKASDLSVSRRIAASRNYHAIGYDESTGRFAAVFEQGTGVGRRIYCDILDSSCTNVLGTFSADTNLTYQGLAVHNSLIYYTCWERGAVNSQYEPVYDGVFQKGDNVIYVYDFSGRLVKRLLAVMPEGYSKFELETASFIGNRMILQFNETVNGNKLIGLYEVIAEGPSYAQQAAAEKAAKKAAEEKQAAEEFGFSKTKITGIVRKKKRLKISWKELNAGDYQADGYEVQVCRKKTFYGSSLRTAVTSGKKATVKGLKRKKTYYVRVRGYITIGSHTYYSRWSARKKVRTR